MRRACCVALVATACCLAAAAPALDTEEAADRIAALVSTLDPMRQLQAYQHLTELATLQRVIYLVQRVTPSAQASARASALIRELMGESQERLQAVLPGPGGGTSPALPLQRRVGETLMARMAAPRGVLGAAGARLKGVVTLVNIAWFAGCMLLAAAAVSLFGAYAAALLLLLPKQAYEAGGYAAAAWLLSRAAGCPPATAPYIGLTGLLVFTGAAGGTIALHGLADRFKSEGAVAGLLGFFAAAYAAVAVRLQAPLLGTLAVWWAMAALGFVVSVFPFLTVIGFRSGMLRPFLAALALLLVFLPYKVAPEALPLPAAMLPFEQGVWLWCPLVLNVANLIMAHSRWDDYAAGLPAGAWPQLPLHVRLQLLAHWVVQYAVGQLPAVAVIGGTLACGTMLDVEPCRAVGAVFAFIWFLSKLAECNWQRVGFAWAALVFGGVLWGAAYAAHTRPQALQAILHGTSATLH